MGLHGGLGSDHVSDPLHDGPRHWKFGGEFRFSLWTEAPLCVAPSTLAAALGSVASFRLFQSLFAALLGA